MIQVKLPTPVLKVRAVSHYSSPLSALYFDFLACLSRIQRTSNEHIVLPERVPQVELRSAVGRKIVDGSHPLRKLLSGERSLTPQILSLWEARSAIDSKIDPVYVALEAPCNTKGAEIAQCKAVLSFLMSVSTEASTSIVIELVSVTSPVSLVTVEVFASCCKKAKIVHTIADDRIYLVGKIHSVKKEVIGAILKSLSEDVSKIGLVIATESILVKTIGEIYTWRCNTMDRLITKVNQASLSHSVQDLRGWLDNFIDSSFKDMSEQWMEKTRYDK